MHSVRRWIPANAFKNIELVLRCILHELWKKWWLHYSNKNKNNVCVTVCTSWQNQFSVRVFFVLFCFFLFRLMLWFWLMFCSCFQALFIMHEPDSRLVIISNVLDLQHQAQRLKGGSRQHIQPVILATICLSRALWVSNQIRQNGF